MTNDWVLNMFRECLGKRMLRVDTVCISSKVLKKASDCEKYMGAGGGGGGRTPPRPPLNPPLLNFKKKIFWFFQRKPLKIIKFGFLAHLGSIFWSQIFRFLS